MTINALFLAGMQSLQSGLNRTAIASTGLNVERDDFANRMVALRQGEIEAKAAANVIRTADEMLGTIIDVRR